MAKMPAHPIKHDLCTKSAGGKPDQATLTHQGRSAKLYPGQHKPAMIMGPFGGKKPA